MNKDARRRRALVQLSLLSAYTMVACGGGEGNGGGEFATARADASGKARESALADAPVSANTIVVRAYGTLAGNVGPSLQVLVNRNVVASVEVRAAAYQNYTFTVPTVPAGAKVDILYSNDAVINGQDRTLYVDSVTVLGSVLRPTDAGVTYDIGYGPLEGFDGIDVATGRNMMSWSGALRFTAPAAPAPAPTPAPVSSPTPASVPGAPVVFNASSSGRAGDVVMLQGENFGAAPSVWLDAPGQPSTQLAIVAQSGSGALSVQIPATATAALPVRVVNAGVSSTTVQLNGARAYHLDTLELVPNGAFRVFGRNLRLTGSTPVVTVDGLVATVNTAASDEHMLVVTAPGGLTANARSVVTVNNGNGSGATTLDRSIATIVPGAGDPFGLGVGWAAGFTPLTARVIAAATDSRLAVKAVCNGSQDDTAAIQAAVNLAAANAGGIVQLPAGTCRIAGIVTLKSKVVLQGAGKTATTLRYERNYPLWLQNVDYAGIRNLSLVNAGGAQQGPLLRNNTHMAVQNVKIDMGTSYQIFLVENKNSIITGSDFVQGTGINGQGPYVFHASSGLVFRNNTTVWGTGSPAFGQVHDAYFQGNRFTRKAAVQDSGIVHGFTMDFAYRIAVVGNTFDVLGGPITNKTRNDGETLLTEGGGAYGNTENLGTVGSATALTMSDPSNTIKVDPFNSGSIPENSGVAIVGGKGAGQTRRVTAYSAGKLTVERAWDVIPDTTSKYATFIWGLEKSLLKGNTLSQNPRGIWLYQTAVREVDIVGNQISEGGGIYLRSAQKLVDRRFDPIYNVRIAGNRLSSTTGNWPASINVVFVNMDAKAFGVGNIGIEVRDNQLTANPFNLSLASEEYAGVEGYMNMMRVENYSLYESMSLPRVMNTVFERNVCTNCDVGFRVGTGAGGTVLKAGQLINSKALWSNSRTTTTPEVAVGTVVR